MCKFIEIDIQTLLDETILDFDLYIINSNRYVLYRSKNLPFKKDIRLLLYKKKIKLYIEKQAKKVYIDYLKDNLIKLTDEKNKNLTEKTEYFYNTSKKIMHSLFDNPKPEEIEVCINEISDVSLKLIFDNKTNVKDVLNIMSFDYSTYTHSINVGMLALHFAKKLQYPETNIKQLAMGAFFHDIGKSKIPEKVLLKPGKLNEEEWKLMKKHPTYSYEILKEIKDITELSLTVAKHHHEKFNGFGYPEGLKNDDITLETQIVTICDVFDALTTRRCYKDAINSFPAIQIMLNDMKGTFNEELLQIFLFSLT